MTFEKSVTTEINLNSKINSRFLSRKLKYFKFLNELFLGLIVKLNFIRIIYSSKVHSKVRKNLPALF